MYKPDKVINPRDYYTVHFSRERRCAKFLFHSLHFRKGNTILTRAALYHRTLIGARLCSDDYYEAYYHATAKLTLGTGQRILEVRIFRQWLRGSEEKVDSTMLWLHGAPGTGRYILCSTVIDCLQQQRTGRQQPTSTAAHRVSQSLDRQRLCLSFIPSTSTSFSYTRRVCGCVLTGPLWSI